MKKLLLMLLSAITVVACGSGDDDSTTPAPIPSLGGVGEGVQSQRLLTVEIGGQPMQEEDAAAPFFNRTAAATTTETLSAFTMHYLNDEWSKEFTKTGSEWSTASWPIPGEEKIDVYANNEGTYIYNSGNPYVSFTALEDAFNTKDFLVAEHKNIAYSDEGGKVSLSFRHACAAVQFQIWKTQTQASHNFVVTSAKLLNVDKHGDYYYTDGWKNVDTPTDYTLNNSSITLTTDYQLLPCQWLFVVPQSKSGITLELKYTVDGGEEKTKNIPLGTDSWAAGYRYTVNIKVGTSFL